MGARSPSSSVMRGAGADGERASGAAPELEVVAAHLARRARPVTAHGALPSPVARSPRGAPDVEARRALGLLIDSARRESADRGPLEEQRWRLWAARLARWSRDWDAAGRALDEMGEGAARCPDPSGGWLAAAAFEERLALALDRGERRRAFELLGERPEHDGPTGALLRWAAGDDEAAHRIGDADPGDWAARALRCDPDAPLLVELDLDRATARNELDRASVGARAVVLVALEEPGGRVVSADVAPGLADGLEPWSVRARDAHLDAAGPQRRGRPGQQAVVLARGAARPRDEAAIEASCLGGAASAARAILCVPLAGTRGLGGWLWAEFDHRLLPATQQIASLAVAAEAALARRRGGDVQAWGSPIGSALGKLARRRWALLTPGGLQRGAPASSGGAGALGGLRAREAWPASRALREGRPVRYGPVLRSRAHRLPSDRGADTLFEGSSSGAALPLRVGAVPVAAVVVESTRREDARPENVERWERGLDRTAHAVFAAALDERLRGRGGFGLDVAAPDGRAFVEWLARAGAGSGAQVFEIAGPAGAGRMAAAAALHEARAWFGACGPLTLVAPDPRELGPGCAIGRAMRPGATVVVPRVRRAPGGRARDRGAMEEGSGEEERRARPDHAAGRERGEERPRRNGRSLGSAGAGRTSPLDPLDGAGRHARDRGESRGPASSRSGHRRALATAVGPRRPRPRRPRAFRRGRGSDHRVGARRVCERTRARMARADPAARGDCPGPRGCRLDGAHLERSSERGRRRAAHGVGSVDLRRSRASGRAPGHRGGEARALVNLFARAGAGGKGRRAQRGVRRAGPSRWFFPGRKMAIVSEAPPGTATKPTSISLSTYIAQYFP